MRVGVWFYGLATFVTGLLDIACGAFDASHQPLQSFGQHGAEPHLLAYVAGVCLAAAGIAILWRRTARVGAVVAGLIYLIFALAWLPRFPAAVHHFGFRIGVLIFVLGGLAQELLLAAPAAIVYAATASPDSAWRARALLAARWMLGLGPIAFGLGHLINAPAVARFVPHWVPFAITWTVVTGIAFLLAGCAIVTGIRDLLAARLLVLMLLLFDFIVEIPPIVSQPHSQVAWGGAAYNLVAIGAYWMFVEALSSRLAHGAEDDAGGRVAAPRRGPVTA